MSYLLNLFIAFDQLLTTVVGGYPDETLSSYAYRLEREGKVWGKVWRPTIDWLFSWQGIPQGHCFAANQQERLRYQFPPELR